MNSIELLKRIKAISKIASKDVTRYHLNGVYLSVTDNIITLSVTDGHRLIEETHPIDSETMDITPDAKGIIYTEYINRLNPILKAHKYTTPQLTITETTLSIDGVSIPLDKVNYPNTKALIPNYKSKTISFGINARYLLDLAQALTTDDMSRSGKDNIKITLPVRDIRDDKNNLLSYEIDVSPLTISKTGNTTPNIKAIVMPVRI